MMIMMKPNGSGIILKRFQLIVCVYADKCCMMKPILFSLSYFREEIVQVWGFSPLCGVHTVSPSSHGFSPSANVGKQCHLGAATAWLSPCASTAKSDSSQQELRGEKRCVRARRTFGTRVNDSDNESSSVSHHYSQLPVKPGFTYFFPGQR